MDLSNLFKSKKEKEEQDLLLELKGVTPETLKNLSNNKGED